MKYIVQFYPGQSPSGMNINMTLIHREMNTYVTASIDDEDKKILEMAKTANKVKLFYPNIKFDVKPTNSTTSEHVINQKFHYVCKTEDVLDEKKTNLNGDDIVCAIFEPTFRLTHNEFNLWRNTDDVTSNNNIGVDYTWYTNPPEGTTYTTDQDFNDDLNLQYDSDDYYGVRIVNDSNGRPAIRSINNSNLYTIPVHQHATQVASVLGSYADNCLPVSKDYIGAVSQNIPVGNYSAISVTTSGNGTGLKLNVIIDKTNNQIYVKRISINTSGSNYGVGDTINIRIPNINIVYTISFKITSNNIDIINGNSTALTNGVTGIAPGIKLLPVDFPELTNAWYPDHFIAGLGYVTDLRREYNNDNTKGVYIVAMNMSFGIETQYLKDYFIQNGVASTDIKSILEHMFTDPINRAGAEGILCVATMDNSITYPTVDYGDRVDYLPACICRDNQLNEPVDQPASSPYIISVIDVSTVYTENDNTLTSNIITNGAIRSNYSKRRACIAGDGAIYKFPRYSSDRTFIEQSYYAYGTSFVAPQVSGAIAMLHGSLNPSLISKSDGTTSSSSEIALLIKNTLIESASKETDTVMSSLTMSHYTKCIGTSIKLSSYCFSGGLLNIERAINQIKDKKNIVDSTKDTQSLVTMVLLTHGSLDDNYWLDIIDELRQSNGYTLIYESNLTSAALLQSRIDYYFNNSANIYGLYITCPYIDSSLAASIRQFSTIRPAIVFDSVGTNDITGALNFTGVNQADTCMSMIRNVDREIKYLDDSMGNKTYLFLAYNPLEDVEWNFGNQGRIKYFNTDLNTVVPTTVSGYDGSVITPYLITIKDDDIINNDVSSTLENLLITYITDNQTLGSNNLQYNHIDPEKKFKIVLLSMSNNHVTSNDIIDTADMVSQLGQKYIETTTPIYTNRIFSATFDITSTTSNIVKNDPSFLCAIGVSTIDIAHTIENCIEQHYQHLNASTSVNSDVIALVSSSEHRLDDVSNYVDENDNPVTGQKNTQDVSSGFTNTISGVIGPQNSGTSTFSVSKNVKNNYITNVYIDDNINDTDFVDVVLNSSFTGQNITMAQLVDITELDIVSDKNRFDYVNAMMTHAANYGFKYDVFYPTSVDDSSMVTRLDEIAAFGGSQSPLYDIIICPMKFPLLSDRLRDLSLVRPIFITELDSLGCPNALHTMVTNNTENAAKRSISIQNKLANLFADPAFGRFVYISYIEDETQVSIKEQITGLLTISLSSPTNTVVGDFIHTYNVLSWELNRMNTGSNVNGIVVGGLVVAVETGKYPNLAQIEAIDFQNVTLKYGNADVSTTIPLSDVQLYHKNNYRVNVQQIKTYMETYIFDDTIDANLIIEYFIGEEYDNIQNATGFTAERVAKLVLIGIGYGDISWRLYMNEIIEQRKLETNTAVILAPVEDNRITNDIFMSSAILQQTYITFPVVSSTTTDYFEKYNNVICVSGSSTTKEPQIIFDIIYTFIQQHKGSHQQYYTAVTPNTLFPDDLRNAITNMRGDWFNINVYTGNNQVTGDFDFSIGENTIIASFDLQTLNYGNIKNEVRVPFKDLVYDYTNSIIYARYKQTNFTMFLEYQLLRIIIREESRNVFLTGNDQYRYDLFVQFTGPIVIHEDFKDLLNKSSDWYFIPAYDENNPQPIQYIVHQYVTSWTNTRWEFN